MASSAYRGAQERVRTLHPSAIYAHRCSHEDSLSFSGASQLLSIRHAMSVVASVCVFISRSAQLLFESSSKPKNLHLVQEVN